MRSQESCATPQVSCRPFFDPLKSIRVERATERGVRSALGGCLLAALLAGCGGVEHPGPYAVVRESVKEVRVGKKVETVRVLYEIKNVGTEDLLFKSLSTTCGCTVGSVNPHRVKPGQVAVVEVIGEPPPAGAKAVTIDIVSNSVPFGRIGLQLTMVREADIPFVAQAPTTIQFGVLGLNNLSSKMTLGTQEAAGAPEWVAGTFSVNDLLEIRRGGVRQVGIGEHTVGRKYEYSVRWKRLPPPGSYSGEIGFLDSQSRSILTVPFHAVVRAPVFAVPAAIYLNMGKNEAPPECRVTLMSSENRVGFRCVASRTPNDVFVVKNLEEANAFAVVFPKGFDGDFEGHVRFETNDPECPRIDVPLTIRVDR